MNGTRKWRPGIERALVAAEPLDDAGAGLRDDADGAREREQDDQPDADPDQSGDEVTLTRSTLVGCRAGRGNPGDRLKPVTALNRRWRAP